MRRTWLITGVSSGFGRHLTEQLLDRGDQVVGTVRRPEATAAGAVAILHAETGRHPDDLDLPYEAAELRGDQDLSLFVYTAEPGSPAADALGILAGWAATREQTNSPTDAADR